MRKSAGMICDQTCILRNLLLLYGYPVFGDGPPIRFSEGYPVIMGHLSTIDINTSGLLARTFFALKLASSVENAKG